MTQKSLTEQTPLMDRVMRLVVKEGVTLGNLSESDRSLALAWVWAGLPAEQVVDERGVNAWLRDALQGPAACLDTDHVELRRWLADGGWLARDGFGREYRRVAVAGLPAHQATLGQALDSVATAAVVAKLRLVRDAARQARHQAWQASQQGAA